MSAKRRIGPIFSTLDLYGNVVELHATTWNAHILDEHPEMHGCEDLVKSVLSDPFEIRLSTLCETSLAFISESNIGPRPEGIRVLVEYTDTTFEKGSVTGNVSTAYPIDLARYRSPQIGKRIYTKGKP